MVQRLGAWDGRRRAISLGIFSNAVGALAAAGAAIAAWLTTSSGADLTQWALILAGVGGVFVAKGTIILALAERRPTQSSHDDAAHQLNTLENRMTARHKALVDRVNQLEAELAQLRASA
ncbi:hypothetical protein VW35_02100 [Devosia soli]|uniref:Uncharacterized protein n=1 Tax=Devosia soli TaxID=361041 RepID=A0A0F5LHD0_9HYPH|nr:hypothetical protein [Devosia soli]KKB80987.1 hypothetical protein VW35_02100 [Devosia soli]